MSDRPNILLVAFDSLSAHDLGRHLDNLPTLRGLLEQSLSFTNAYTCCPESSPARASLFTGLDIAVHGLWTDGVTLPKRETPIAQVCAAQGYQSWLVGRRQLAGVSHWTTEHARAPEHHHFDWAHGPLHRSRQNAYLTWLQGAAPESYAEIFPAQADPDDTAIPPEQRQAMMALPDQLSFNTWIGQQACARIENAPFCGIIGFVVGQTMGATAAPVEALNPRSLQQADVALAAVLEALPKNTVIVVTAGRGSVSNPATPHLLQEAAIKVPLLIRLPIGQAQTVPDIVSTMDIASTLYELAGVQPPQRVQGKSLTSAPPRGWALSRLRHPDLAQQTALRTERWKLIVTHDAPDATQLYDLRTDAAETKNLAGHEDQVEELMDLMIDARVALEDRLEPRIAKF